MKGAALERALLPNSGIPGMFLFVRKNGESNCDSTARDGLCLMNAYRLRYRCALLAEHHRREDFPIIDMTSDMDILLTVAGAAGLVGASSFTRSVCVAARLVSLSSLLVSITGLASANVGHRIAAKV